MSLTPPIHPGTNPPFGWLSAAAWAETDIDERALLWAAYFADVEKVIEVPKDSNRGLWVEAFQRVAGCNPGDPWCASFVAACNHYAGRIKLPPGAAAVRFWASSPKLERVSKPRRGDMFYWLQRDGRGHIGFVVKIHVGYVETIEGNTQPTIAGDQREGGGCYRRRRLRTPNLKFLRWK